MRVWGLQSMINDRALGFSRMGKEPSSLFSIHSRLPTFTAVAFAVSNISSWIYRETASIFAVEHNALFELSLKCCAHDSLARPGKFVCVCVLGARPPARARAYMQQRLFRGDHHYLFKFGPEKACLVSRESAGSHR